MSTGEERGRRARDLERGLERELRELGRGLRVPDVGGQSMAERVLAQLLAESVPVPVPVAEPPGRGERIRAWARRRWRALGVALSGALVVLVLTPPVRAAVADWFGFGGVQVRYDPSATPAPGASPVVPGCASPVPLAEAGRRAGFEPRVPGALGAPDAVSVGEAPGGRHVVSLCWHEPGRTIRLDEFPARLDVGFGKTVREEPEYVELGGVGPGYWFARPHLLTFPMTDGEGRLWTHSQRTAGPTLLWTGHDGLTLRLEGEPSQTRARAIAEST
ncbi:hypothetical protein [Streptomyces sp. CB03238]|uniref:hypothetical protein n=1 Tax=Streptomyces sp. CB03238 TaxID=1907777 RepID=UPI000A100959|nr:hypothetical protein [Streptomyces sp. CB03238]ORT59538.1 hypothetical protein BKD26_11505 [Streptomyces sp. CB03238]